MLLEAKKIIGLPVVTVAGDSVGKVVDVNIDIENHLVKSYAVKSGWANRQTYLISPVQVKSITADQITVDDALVKNWSLPEPKKGIGEAMLGNVATMENE